MAVTFTSAVDDPARFRRSRAVGAHFGLTPKKYQSGRDRRDRRDQQGRRRDGAHRAVRGRERDADPGGQVLDPQALGRWRWRSAGACGGPRWRWRASSRPSCTASGSTAASSASARRRQRRDRLSGRRRASERARIVPLPRGPVAGTREPARPLIREWRRLGGDHASLDWPAGSPLIAWCGGPGADHGRKPEPGGRMVTRGA